MEKNTFATTVFAATAAEHAFAYLRHLPNLDEWTLGSRMRARIDDDTYMGTASGYQTMLCYHVRPLTHPRFHAIEWQCGYRYREYFKQYPVFVFPARYVDPTGDEVGSYIHWVSVIDPARRTPMIMEGIEAVHRYEGRGLKAALERREGLSTPAEPRFQVHTDTMYVDAPLELAVEELSNTANLPDWAPLFRRASGGAGAFVDEYGRSVEARFSAERLEDYVLIEQDYIYPTLGVMQRYPIVLIPCARAFSGNPSGFLLHRLGFWERDAVRTVGRRDVHELTAESMAIKRRLEARAGNFDSFGEGMSYTARETAPTLKDDASAPPDIFGAEFIRDPYPSYAQMREHHPLYFHPGAQAWILSRYEDVHTALTDPRFTTESYASQTEPLLGRTIIQLDGREHALERSLLAPVFGAASIQERWAGAIRAIVDELIAGFRSRGHADLVSELAAQLPVRMMAAILGLPSDQRERFRGWYTALIRGALNLQRDPEVARAAESARDDLSAFLRTLVAARRGRPGIDLLSQLTQTEIEQQKLTDEQIVRFGMLMVFAAGETTEKGLATALRNIIARPEVLARVRRERSLLPRAIAESFRLTAPTHMVPRRTSEEVRLSGGIVPRGAEVMCFLGSANRDARRFSRPDEFDLDRPEADAKRAFTGQAAHLAFGGGRHFCLGAVLARYEIEITLDRLLSTFGELRFADGAVPADVGLFLRGPIQLPVTFTPG